MPLNQTHTESFKNIAKFFWRHIFTLYILSVIIRASIAGSVVILPTMIYLSGAIILDWAKQFIKLTPNSNRTHLNSNGIDSMNSSSNHWADPYVVGSDANLMKQNRDNY